MKKFTIATTGLLVAALAVPTLASAASITVKSGDTLYSLASKHNLSVNELKSYNKLSSNIIKPGQTLQISKPATINSVVKKEYRTVTASALNVRTGAGNSYKASTVIKKGTEVEILSTTNGWAYIVTGNTKGYVYSSYLSGPRFVTSEVPTSPSSDNTQNTTHTVQSGETLYSISSKYKMSVTTLKSLNKMTTNTIYKGQKLIIKNTSTTPTPTPPPANIQNPTTYKVKSGDTLFSVASQFNMSINTLKSINGLTSNIIYVGQSLKVEGQKANAIFDRPSDGIQTSEFGPRWGTFHYGIDFAKAGAVENKAAASGVVSRSYTSDSYGEVVFIVHEINGQTYETVYAHMKSGSRAVQVGDKVTTGQFLGWMGSTGHSTGQHLHFEVHKGRWNAEKSNAVDPVLFLK
ncbi:LysM peptidoglycan-binding domain-containing protein [[Brevibacterium] frigoritolerans]|nr:LysM peptidoglycan-binding domain-containing protein [Peribacillus frigoritolerans]